MESTPQSTINHNAVIELASDLLRCPPRHRCYRGGRSKSRPALPKGWPEIGRDHAKIAPPAQRQGLEKWSISAGICAATGHLRKIPKNGCRKCASTPAPAL